MMKKALGRILAWMLVIAGAATMAAQDCQQLHLDIQGSAFFKNNEFDTQLMNGYTLPGWRLSPTLRYQPSSAITLEGGAYMMHYFGARIYPYADYQGIPDYSDSGSRGVHALPVLRVAMTVQGWQFVLGTLYDSADHGLLRPLCAPERRLTADPEAGVQVRHYGRCVDLDVWADWRTFIYNQSPYRENFYVGLSSKVKYNSSESTLSVYTPIQLMIEHRGGEIDTIHTNSVMTFVNGAVGVGARLQVGRKWLDSVTLEADVLGSWQQAGQAWPWKKGWGAYVHGTAQVWNVNVELGYYHADRFATIQGLPLWGVVGPDGRACFRTNDMVHLGIGYERELHPGYVLAARADAYQARSATSLSFELVMRWSPSWLIWKK